MRPALRIAAVAAALSIAPVVRADEVPGTTTPPAAAPAPAPGGTIVRVRLRDGQELRGRLVQQTPDGVVVELPGGGQMPISAAVVERVDEERSAAIVNGEIWAEDRNRTRYLYAPSAFTLRQGEIYFSQKELLFSSFGAGLTDHVTVLVGSVLPLWFVPDGLNVIGAVKIGAAATDWLHLAAGAEVLVLPRFGGGGFAFAAVTIGHPTAHLTVAAGPPFAFGSGTSEVGDAIVVVSGNVRVASSVALVTENWIFPTGRVNGELAMLNGAAVRLFGDRVAVDVGLVRVAGSDVPVPWLDFTWNFASR